MDITDIKTSKQNNVVNLYVAAQLQRSPAEINGFYIKFKRVLNNPTAFFPEVESQAFQNSASDTILVQFLQVKVLLILEELSRRTRR